MKILLAIMLLFSVYAEDTFTLEEFKRIDKHVKAAVSKRFTPAKLKQVKQESIDKNRLYKVGDKFTAMTGGKHYKGIIHRINANTIQIGTHDFSKKDYPPHYFNKEFNMKVRADYVQKHYIDAKRIYLKRAEDHYKKLTLSKRPNSKPQFIPEYLPEIQKTTIAKKVNSEIPNDIFTKPAKLNFASIFGSWFPRIGKTAEVDFSSYTQINQDSIDIWIDRNGIEKQIDSAKILKIKVMPSDNNLNKFMVTVKTSKIQNWIIVHKGEFLTINFGWEIRHYYKLSLVNRLRINKN